MSLEKQDILQCYANRQVPNYLPTLITQNQNHFTQYSLKPEFIKANVFEIFKNIAGNNPDLSMLSKSISQLHENVRPDTITQDEARVFFIRIGEDRQGPFVASKIMRFLKKSDNLKNVVVENSVNGKAISGDTFLKKNKDFKSEELDTRFIDNSKNGQNNIQTLDKKSFLNSHSEIDLKSEKSNFLLDNLNYNDKQRQDPFLVSRNQQQIIECQNGIPQQNFNLGQTQNNCTYQLDQGLDFSLFGNQNYLQNDFQNSFSDDQMLGINPAQQIIDSDEESISEESQKEFKPDGKHPDSLAFWNQYNKNVQNQLSDISQQDEQTEQNDDSILQEIKRLQIGQQKNKSPKKSKKNSRKVDTFQQNGQNIKESKQLKKKKKNRKLQQDNYPVQNQFQQGNFVYPNNTIQNLYAQQNNISIVGQFNQQQILSPQELAQFQQNFIMSQNAMLAQSQPSLNKPNKKKKKDASKYNANLLQSQFQNNFAPQYMSNQFYMNQNSSQIPQQHMQNYMGYYGKELNGTGQYQMLYDGYYQPSQPPMMDQNGFQAYNHDFQNPQQVKKRSKKSKKPKQQNQIFDYQLGNYENGAYPNYFQNF